MVFRWLIGIFVVFVCIISVYLLSSYLLGIVSCNTDFEEDPDGIEIFVKSNGVHTDLVFPINSSVFNWDTFLERKDFYPMNAKYVAFGWGDRGFYLETPTWADLKFETAFKALFWLGSGAMHVSLYEKIKPGDKTRSVRISPHQYDQLVTYVKNSFRMENNNIVLIRGHHYENVNDNFYDATGTYNFLFTCNTWTNDALKKAGIKTAIWTPFEWAILKHRPNSSTK